jgi:hypothetical protein
MLNGQSATSLLGSIEASFVGSGVSDLIAITVKANSPEKAAAIANSWAKHYVEHINILYGEMPTEMSELVETELGKAETRHKTAQQAYENFLGQNEIPALTRLIGEKQQLIASLQHSRQVGLGQIVTQTLTYRNDVITTYLSALQQNRMLAFVGEQEANRTLVQNLIQAISENRQLAFSMEHKARTQLFTQYAELELQNRLLAMQQEQATKTEIFKAYSGADLQAKLTVFNQQINTKVETLIRSYTSKQRLEQLLDQARALQQQVEQAGEAGARTNSLPILLLKIEVFAATGTNTQADGSPALDNMQLNLAANNGLDASIENQTMDLAVLIDTVTKRMEELDTRIEQLSSSLFNNEGYQWLEGVRPEDDALFAAIQKQYLALFDIDALAQAENAVGDDSVLSQAILAKYDELFELGSLTSSSLLISDTTPIYVALESQYPSLFSIGDLSQLGDTLSTGSALDEASQGKIAEILQPLDSLESYFAATETSAQPILQLEEELRQLEATLEHQQFQHDTLLYKRDKALEAYNTLSNKLLELTLQRTAANREVRFAAAANPPDRPIPSTSWVSASSAFGLVGFVLAIIIALLASYLDKQPFLSALRPPQVRVAGPISQ